ncbi:hypothetical protein AB0J09_10725, partial [Nonomuraea sp. NPDC049784]
MSSTPRDLVMNHPISRRDFFDGMALGCVVTESPRGTAYSPEPFTVRGGAAEALSVPHALRDGRFWRHAGRPEPTGE